MATAIKLKNYTAPVSYGSLAYDLPLEPEYAPEYEPGYVAPEVPIPPSYVPGTELKSKVRVETERSAGRRVSIVNIVGFAVVAVALLLVPREQHDEIRESVAPYGVFTLAKPTTAENAAAAIGWLVSARERLRQSEKKTRSLEDMMEEIRLVNRAKWALIHEMGMSEPEAHHYIEKQAMDRCVSKRELAQEIIRLYG